MPTPPITIAVDARGGDSAPRREVEGAVLAAEELGLGVLLVGQEELVRKELRRYPARHLPVEVVHGGGIGVCRDS